MENCAVRLACQNFRVNRYNNKTSPHKNERIITHQKAVAQKLNSLQQATWSLSIVTVESLLSNLASNSRAIQRPMAALALPSHQPLALSLSSIITSITIILFINSIMTTMTIIVLHADNFKRQNDLFSDQLPLHLCSYVIIYDMGMIGYGEAHII